MPKHLTRLWHLPDLADAVGAIPPVDLPQAEEGLLALLAHPHVAVARAAVMQLGGVPRRDVIDALRDCADRHRGNPELEAAVRQAIAEIQSRLPGASPGQLSIAGAEAGQVSLAEEDRRGEVSLERSGSE